MRPRWKLVARDRARELEGATSAGFNLLRFDIPFLAEELHRVGVEWDQPACAWWMCSASSTRWNHANLSAALKFYCGREHAGAHDAWPMWRRPPMYC
jgi:DNA polymerase-3 subunit epsilon